MIEEQKGRPYQSFHHNGKYQNGINLSTLAVSVRQSSEIEPYNVKHISIHETQIFSTSLIMSFGRGLICE